MKPSLLAQHRQQLTLTPSLTHAIGLLQLSQSELLEEISSFCEKNTFLEHSSPSFFKANIMKNDIAGIDTSALYWDLNLYELNESIYQLAFELLGSVNEYGYSSIDFWSSISEYNALELKKWLKTIEPIGLGASSYQERISLICENHPIISHHHLNEALKDLLLNLESLKSHEQIKRFKKKHKLSPLEFEEIKKLTKFINFNPCLNFKDKENFPEVQKPDLIIYQEKNYFKVKLNEEIIPTLSLIDFSTDILQSTIFKQQINEAKSFIRIINTRFSTLLKVASIIVDYQQDFFKYGKIKIKPLILEDIALESGFHESTISRITTKKTIQTPFGIIELRDLLSRSIKKNTQLTSSVCSVKQIIASIIENENKKEPFSDQEITDILEKQGYQIARRTVAKYREQLRIPTSINRKLT